jgi:lysophospholipase L1-like esterase
MHKLIKPAIFIGSFCIAILLAEAVIFFLSRSQYALDLGEIIPWEAYGSDYIPAENRFGCREEDPADAVSSENVIRILMLGDSFTYGTGLADGSKRFSDIVERRLNEDGDLPETQYHVYNAGIQGGVPEHWYPLLQKFLSYYRPHVAIAVFFLRDGTDMCTSLRCHEEVINRIKEPYRGKWWYRYSNLGKFIANRLIRKEFSDYYLGQIQKAYTGGEGERSTWIRQQQSLRDIRDLCLNNDIAFHLIIFPMLYDLDAGYQFHEVENEIVRFARDESIPVFSLTTGFIGQASHTLWISPNDQHPNAKGHMIAANTLYPYIKKVLMPVKSR